MAYLQKNRTLVGLVALTWLAGAISFYYVNHKPITLQTALVLVQSMGNLGISMLILSVAGGVGARWLNPGEIPSLPKIILQVAWGLGVLSLIIMGVGILLGFGAWPLWGLLTLLVLSHWRSIWDWWKSLRALALLWQQRGRFNQAFLISSGLIALATLGMALAPPVKFDALVYHLALPRYYLETGQLVPWEGAWFWGMPQAGEMLYTLALALAGDRAAACLSWMIGIMALVGIWGFTQQYLNRRSAWIAVSALLSGYSLTSGLASAYVDWLAILYGIAGLITLDAWRRNSKPGLLILTGVLGGMAIGVKYTAGVFLLTTLVVVLWQNLTMKRPPAQTIRQLLILLMSAAFLTAPWLIKNASYTGNPVYPFLFPTEMTSQFRLDFYQISTWGDWRDIILLPLRATYTGIEGTPGYSTTISPLFLALIPLIFLRWKRIIIQGRSALISALMVGLSGLLIWVIASRFSGLLVQSRLYFILFPSLGVLAGGGFLALEQIKLPGVRLSRVAGALLLVVVALSAFQVWSKGVEMGVSGFLGGHTSVEAYQDNNLGWYAPALRALKKLEPGSKVLMLWEPRGYSCLPACLPDEVLDRWITDRFKYGDPERIYRQWQNLGISHVMYNRFGADFIRDLDTRYALEDWLSLESILTKMELVEDFGGAYQLYRVSP